MKTSTKVSLIVFAIVMMAAFVIAGFVFWLAFFVAAPHLAAAIPPSAWKPLLDLAAYGLVGYLGGVGGPIFILCLGVVIGAAAIE
jgi:hypothetical protein